MKKNVMTLLDGREVILFPMPKDKMLDEYMVVHNRRNAHYADAQYYDELRKAYERYLQDLDSRYETETKDAEELFLSNVKTLYDNTERILTDSRMFLSPLPCAGGLAYGGAKVFEKPVLGVYLQWWATCHEAHSKDDEWVYHISGSPLSGMNSCGIVNAEGETKSACLPEFANVWKSFARINKMYRGLSDTYDHYPLCEVIKMLK